MKSNKYLYIIPVLIFLIISVFSINMINNECKAVENEHRLLILSNEKQTSFDCAVFTAEMSDL